MRRRYRAWAASIFCWRAGSSGNRCRLHLPLFHTRAFIFSVLAFTDKSDCQTSRYWSMAFCILLILMRKMIEAVGGGQPGGAGFFTGFLRYPYLTSPDPLPFFPLRYGIRRLLVSRCRCSDSFSCFTGFNCLTSLRFLCITSSIDHKSRSTRKCLW